MPGAISVKWLGLVCLLAGIAAIAFRSSYPSVTIRYRLTLEATVEGVSRAGSSVVEVTYEKQPRIANASPLIVGFRGEALVLDLGSKGPVFALLIAGDDSRSSPQSIVLRAFQFPGGALPEPVDFGLEQIRKLQGKRDLPLTSLPLLVRFRDLNDPRTVEKVDPRALGGSLNDDAKLDRASLEIVPVGIWPLDQLGLFGEPITTGILSILPWLPKYYDTHFDGERYENFSPPRQLANSLASGAFKAGL